jgi:hypothetical protein
VDSVLSNAADAGVVITAILALVVVVWLLRDEKR